MKAGIFILSFILLESSVAFGQQFKNLDFNERCDNSKTGLCHWDLSWGGKDAVKQESAGKSNHLLIHSSRDNSVGFTEQSSDYASNGIMKVITVSATVSSESIEGKGAGLNIGLYDKNGVLIGTKDMGGFYSLEWIKGTTGWRKYSIALVCPIETVKIKIGAILFGKGSARFKDYKVVFTPLGNRKPSKLVTKYISAACDTIAKHSLVRDSINIVELKKTALQIAGPAKTYADCYLAINYLLESLRPYGDHHSFLMKADELRNWKSGGSVVSEIEYPKSKLIDQFGYISVPGFHGGNPKLMLAFADSLQAAINRLQNSSIKGWVIDLRENTGGNMSPMLAGLGPLFSAEKLGSLKNVNNQHDAWYYKNGRYYMSEDTGWAVSNPVILKSKLPIAVLTSNRVGSSGEIVVISFIGNALTKSFGQATMGLTTGNGSFDLPDGSQIFLASTIMVDRNGKEYHGSISPDFPVESSSDNKTDKVLEAAITWLLQQN